MQVSWPYIHVVWASSPGWLIHDTVFDCVNAPDAQLVACTVAPDESIDVSTGAELMAALLRINDDTYTQCTSKQWTVRVTANISLANLDWPADGIPIHSNVSIRAAAQSGPVYWDMAMLNGAVILRGGAHMDLYGLVMLNVPNQDESLLDMPLWFFDYERESPFVDTPPLQLFNCALVLPSDEFKYMSYW